MREAPEKPARAGVTPWSPAKRRWGLDLGVSHKLYSLSRKMLIRVAELSRRCGVRAETVRYYTKIGLLNPVCDPGNGYHLFDENDFKRMLFILKAKRLGFTLSEIKRIMEESTRGGAPCAAVRTWLRRRMEDNRKRLEQQQALQARMEAAWKRWAEMPDCMPGEEGFCGLIEAAEVDCATIDKGG